MRIISQDGTVDVPYDGGSLTIGAAIHKDIEAACIFYHNNSSPRGTKLAEYKSKAKAEKAMEMLHEAYVGLPIIMQNVEISEDVAAMFERWKKQGIIVQTPEKEPSKVEYVNNGYFRFPADEDVEV